MHQKTRIVEVSMLICNPQYVSKRHCGRTYVHVFEKENEENSCKIVYDKKWGDVILKYAVVDDKSCVILNKDHLVGFLQEVFNHLYDQTSNNNNCVFTVVCENSGDSKMCFTDNTKDTSSTLEDVSTTNMTLLKKLRSLIMGEKIFYFLMEHGSIAPESYQYELEQLFISELFYQVPTIVEIGKTIGVIL